MTEVNKINVRAGHRAYVTKITREAKVELEKDAPDESLLFSIQNGISEKLTNTLRSMGSSWNYILEASPWWGGFWERMVKSTKQYLRKYLRKSKLSYEELLTVLAEVECVLNSRPLCVIPEGSLEEIITPSHLLLGRRLLNSREENESPVDFNADFESFSNRLKYLKNILENFWGQWKHEYLTGLREMQNCNNKVPQKLVEKGDLVLIHDKLPRNRWKVGIVETLHPSRDGFTRGCNVRTLTKTGRLTYLNRPVNKLYPLEIKSKSVQDDLAEDGTEDLNPNSNDSSLDLTNSDVHNITIRSNSRSRLKRVAAETGILKRIFGNTNSIN